MNILFIGNSLMHHGTGGDADLRVTEQFETLANLGGHLTGVSLVTLGGGSLEEHWFDTEGKIAADEIRSGQFDLVILMSSVGNVIAVDQGEDPNALADFNQYADLFGALCDEYGAASMYQSTWGRDYNIGIDQGDRIGILADQMYRDTAIRNDAAFSPNTLAWAEAHRQLTLLYGNGDDGETAEAMMYDDAIHPTALSAYLVACVLYVTTFNEMPPEVSVYSPPGFSLDDAALMRQIAWDTAQNSAIFHVPDTDPVGGTIVNGTSSADTLAGTIYNDTLNGFDGKDILYGGDGDDSLNGGSGDDRLEGQSGDDIMSGGIDNDSYYVTDSGDVVIEASSEGSDRVYSSISWTLSNNVERLILQTTANLDATGNDQKNTLTGNSGSNVLAGLAGADTLEGDAGSDRLIGGLGKDTLTGGSDADTFVFAEFGTKQRDSIKDFVHGQDQIELDATIFGLPVGALDPLRLAYGVNAVDADDRLIYDSATGSIFFDSDGIGSGSKQLVAILTVGNILTAEDILIA